MKQHKNKIIAGIVIALVLAFVFWYGGNAPGLRGWNPQPKDGIHTTKSYESAFTPSLTAQEETIVASETLDFVMTEEPQEQANLEKNPNSEEPKQEVIEVNGMMVDASTGKDQYHTDPVPEGKPLPMEPQDAMITDQQVTCTLSVRCDTILNNMAWLDPEKMECVPDDGIIFSEREVVFYEGESVFHVLLREMKRSKIHIEYENTPIYNSAYIEGINNLYEFDCGELSGWMYRVNGWFPNYGCSRYQLKPGDRIEWVYTCDLGTDVGGGYSTQNAR